MSVNKLYDGPTPYTKERNLLVKFSAGFIVLFMIGVLFTIIFTLYIGCDRGINISHILIENIVIFVCVGIVEYIFFTKVALHYIPTTPSLLIKTVIETLKKQLSV